MVLIESAGRHPLATRIHDPEIDLLRAGDRDAWERLFEGEYSAVFRYLVSRVGDAHAAEDIAGQVFLEAVEGIRRYRDRGRPLRAWLFTIARHRAVDWGRRQQRLNASRAPFPETEPTASGRDATGGIAALLARLSPDQAEVLHLRFVEDCEVEEIARLLGRSSQAVRQLQHRAVTRLRALLADQMTQGETHEQTA